MPRKLNSGARDAREGCRMAGFSRVYAWSDHWLVADETTFYWDDEDRVTDSKFRPWVRALQDIAVSDRIVIHLSTVNHPHIDDGTDCQCAQYSDSIIIATIDGRFTER